MLGHGSLLRRPSSDQSWKNLNKRVIVVFDYNPNNKINIYVYRRIPVSGEEEIREIKKKSPLEHHNIIVISKIHRSLRRNRMFL